MMYFYARFLNNLLFAIAFSDLVLCLTLIDKLNMLASNLSRQGYLLDIFFCLTRYGWLYLFFSYLVVDVDENS